MLSFLDARRALRGLRRLPLLAEGSAPALLSGSCLNRRTQSKLLQQGTGTYAGRPTDDEVELREELEAVEAVESREDLTGGATQHALVHVPGALPNAPGTCSLAAAAARVGRAAAAMLASLLGYRLPGP